MAYISSTLLVIVVPMYEERLTTIYHIRPLTHNATHVNTLFYYHSTIVLPFYDRTYAGISYISRCAAAAQHRQLARRTKSTFA